MHILGDVNLYIQSDSLNATPVHWALLHHPMPFVFFVLICDAWEICLMFCKQRGQYCSLECMADICPDVQKTEGSGYPILC